MQRNRTDFQKNNWRSGFRKEEIETAKVYGEEKQENLEKESELRLPKKGGGWKTADQGEICDNRPGLLAT